MAGDPILYQIKHPIAEQFGERHLTIQEQDLFHKALRRTAAETPGRTVTMTTTPTPAPAPMTARLRELMEEATEGEYSPQKMVVLQMFMGFNAPTILRLLEAVEGAEKALAGLEEAATVANTRHGADRDKSLDRAIIAARSALATLRAAREGAR